MHKLTAGLFMSIDGVVESPNLWQFDNFDDELGAQMGQLLGRVDTAILGRVGYQEWAPRSVFGSTVKSGELAVRLAGTVVSLEVAGSRPLIVPHYWSIGRSVSRRLPSKPGRHAL